MDFKRTLVRLQKGTYSKSIRHLLEAKRACISFELYSYLSYKVTKDKIKFETIEHKASEGLDYEVRFNNFHCALLANIEY